MNAFETEYQIMFSTPQSDDETLEIIKKHGGLLVEVDDAGGVPEFVVSFPGNTNPRHAAMDLLTELYGEWTDPDDYSNAFDDSDTSPAGPIS